MTATINLRNTAEMEQYSRQHHILGSPDPDAKNWFYWFGRNCDSHLAKYDLATLIELPQESDLLHVAGLGRNN